MNRPKLFGALILGATCVIAAPAAIAQDYPTKPIKFIVPVPPGGTLDALARMVAEKLRISFGQPVVVENRVGGQTSVGAGVVASAEPDGHSIVIIANTLVTLPALRKDMPFDPQTALAPIIELAFTPTVVALNPSLPARDWKSFVSMVNGMKEGLSYSSPNIGSPPHLAGELMARTAKLNMVHIPEKGTAPAVADLLGGSVPAMMAPLNAVLEHIRAGKVIPIAVSDATRAPDLPNIPTLNELGLKDYTPVSSWFALLTTAGTPPAIVDKLNAEVNNILKMPDVLEKLAQQSFVPRGGSPQDLAKLMREEYTRNAKIIADSNIKAE
jgi:tripartite-type tricarboxylate transporter receptor subunit TctC